MNGNWDSISIHPPSLLACEVGDQVNEFVGRESFFQAIGHGTFRPAAQGFDVRPGDRMGLPLLISNREESFRLHNANAAEHAPVGKATVIDSKPGVTLRLGSRIDSMIVTREKRPPIPDNSGPIRSPRSPTL